MDKEKHSHLLNPHEHTNYSEITEEIFVGTNFCCQTHFDEKLLKKGVKVDISLEQERIDSPGGVEVFLWLPVRDHDSPTLVQFKVGVACIKESVDAGQKVYVHCANGHGRSPTLVAAYFISLGMRLKDAVSLLESKRSGVQILPQQIHGLEEYQRQVATV